MLVTAEAATQKRCPRCETTKPIEAFRKEPSRRTGIADYCRECEPAVRRAKYLARRDAHRADAKRWQEENPEKYRASLRRYQLKKKYGITPEQWDAMFEEQGGCCLLCRRHQDDVGSLVVDHCHDTKRVRGLLCSPCNAGIGLLQHDVDVLRRAIDYLTREN